MLTRKKCLLTRVFLSLIAFHLINGVTAINFTLRQDDLPKNVTQAVARTTRQILEATTKIKKLKKKYTLQEGTEHLLQFGALLRTQILDTFGYLVYDRYDDFSISQMEALYRVYHETLERKYNIFDIVTSFFKSPDIRPTKVCQSINENVHTCLKESSRLCMSIRKHNKRRLINLNHSPKIYQLAKIQQHFPDGFSLKIILKHLQNGTLKFTPSLLSGLLHNIQYDSFDDEVRTAERELILYLTKSSKISKHSILMTSDEIKNHTTVSGMLKTYLKNASVQFESSANFHAKILAEHVVREVETISQNIQLLGTVYENNTINLKYLFDLVLPPDVLDKDLSESKEYLLGKVDELQIVSKYLKIEKYQQAGPDQLLMEILGQMRDIHFAVDIVSALHTHARFWRRSRAVEDINELLELFSSYENLRNIKEYKGMMKTIDQIKNRLWDTKNVSIEISCSNPRACLQIGLQIVMKCEFIDLKTKILIKNFCKNVTTKGSPAKEECALRENLPMKCKPEIEESSDTPEELKTEYPPEIKRILDRETNKTTPLFDYVDPSSGIPVFSTSKGPEKPSITETSTELVHETTTETMITETKKITEPENITEPEFDTEIGNEKSKILSTTTKLTTSDNSVENSKTTESSTSECSSSEECSSECSDQDCSSLDKEGKDGCNGTDCPEKEGEGDCKGKDCPGKGEKGDCKETDCTDKEEQGNENNNYNLNCNDVNCLDKKGEDDCKGKYCLDKEGKGNCKGTDCPDKEGDCEGTDCSNKEDDCKGKDCPGKGRKEKCKGKDCPDKEEEGDCKGPECPDKEEGDCKGKDCPDKEEQVDCQGADCPDKEGDSDCKGKDCPDNGGKSDCKGPACPDKEEDDCKGKYCPNKEGEGDCIGLDCPDKKESDCKGKDCPNKEGEGDCGGTDCPDKEEEGDCKGSNCPNKEGDCKGKDCPDKERKNYCKGADCPEKEGQGDCKSTDCSDKEGDCKGTDCPDKEEGDCKGKDCPDKEGGDCKGPDCPNEGQDECKGTDCPDKEEVDCKGKDCPHNGGCEGNDCLDKKGDNGCKGKNCPEEEENYCKGSDCPEEETEAPCKGPGCAESDCKGKNCSLDSDKKCPGDDCPDDSKNKTVFCDNTDPYRRRKKERLQKMRELDNLPLDTFNNDYSSSDEVRATGLDKSKPQTNKGTDSEPESKELGLKAKKEKHRKDHRFSKEKSKKKTKIHSPQQKSHTSHHENEETRKEMKKNPTENVKEKVKEKTKIKFGKNTSNHSHLKERYSKLSDQEDSSENIPRDNLQVGTKTKQSKEKKNLNKNNKEEYLEDTKSNQDDLEEFSSANLESGKKKRERTRPSKKLDLNTESNEDDRVELHSGNLKSDQKKMQRRSSKKRNLGATESNQDDDLLDISSSFSNKGKKKDSSQMDKKRDKQTVHEDLNSDEGKEKMKKGQTKLAKHRNRKKELFEDKDSLKNGHQLKNDNLSTNEDLPKNSYEKHLPINSYRRSNTNFPLDIDDVPLVYQTQKPTLKTMERSYFDDLFNEDDNARPENRIFADHTYDDQDEIDKNREILYPKRQKPTFQKDVLDDKDYYEDIDDSSDSRSKWLSWFQ